MWRALASGARSLVGAHPLPPSVLCHRLFSADAAARNAERLLEIMANSPALQQMMTASLPAHMRNDPNIIKTMLSNPMVKQKMVEMIAKQGVNLPADALERLNASNMEATLAQLKRAGINPMDLPQKLMAYPEIYKKLQEPLYMQAFLEATENPTAAVRFPEEVMGVVRKAQEILRTRPETHDTQQTQGKDAEFTERVQSPSASQQTIPLPPPHTDTPIPMPPPPSPTPTTATPPPQATPAQEPSSAHTSTQTPSNVPFAHLLQDPALRSKLQNPRVQKALEEISRSPWKTVKYVFDKEVMEVFTALNKALKTGS